MNLMQVKGRWTLNWPVGIADPMDPRRGPRGYVVDMDAPLERQWCAGQEYKLEPAPKGAKPSPIEHARALAALRDWARKNATASADPAKAKASKPIAADLPAVDLPKPKVAAKA
jgi:hypothetical protein